VCGVSRGGKAYCWGAGENGVLGNGSESAQFKPSPVSSTVEWVNISPYGDLTCGATVSGQLNCWGALAYEPIGKGSRVLYKALTPELMVTAALVSELAEMCVNTQTERAECVAYVSNGSSTHARAVAVPGEIDFRLVAGFGFGACGMDLRRRVGEHRLDQVARMSGVHESSRMATPFPGSG
jgi:hypothetical protein